MAELETLVVPEELGKWLDSMEIGGSGACFTTTINALLFYYWDTTADSSTSRFIAENEKEIIEVIIGSREYKVEEPKYYALIKGHELTDSISKLEKSIFDNNQIGKELMRGVLTGYYIIYNYLEGVDGHERDE